MLSGLENLRYQLNKSLNYFIFKQGNFWWVENSQDFFFHLNHTFLSFNFQAEWHPTRDDIFFVGSMAQPRQIDVYSDQGDHFVLGDGGEYLASVCSIVKCHPTQDIVVGGNSSGRVHVFME